MLKIFYPLISLLLFIGIDGFAQTYTISGKLTQSETREPLYHANIYLKGTTIGTVTDKDGCYILKNIKQGSYTLIVSSIGYSRISQDISLTNNLNKDFTMKKSSSSLGEIVVTGTTTPHHLVNAPVQTELINKKHIEQLAPSNFIGLMSNISPSFDFSPKSLGSFMQLNGLSNDYILVLIDGKRVYGDVAGQTDLNRINPENVQKIEVVKGASSALYGSEAIAGVINIITKKPKQKTYISNSSRIGSYGEWIQNNKLSLNLGKFSSSTSFDRKQTDGWQLSKYELDDEDLAETDKRIQNASSDYTITQHFNCAPTQKLNLYLGGYKYMRDITRPKTEYNYGFIYDNFNYTVGAKYLIGKRSYIQADWNSSNFNYFYKYNQDYSDYMNGEEVKQTVQKRDALNLRSVFGISNSHLFTVGFEYVNEELESEERLVGKNASAYTNAIFAQDEIKLFENLTVVAGVRFLNHKEFGNAFTPKIATLYKLKNFNFRGTYAMGFKAPTIKELYYRYEKRGTLYLGNPDLDPQTSNYYSTAVEYNTKKISTSITAYLNQVNDLIDYETVGTSLEDAANGITSTRLHYNITEAQTQGIDFMFNADLGYGFTLGGGYSYVDAENLTDTIRLENVAQNYANLRLAYTHSWKEYRLNTNITGRFQDEKFYEDEDNAKAYNLWKLTIVQYFNPKGKFNYTLTAGIDNIFDYVDDLPYGSRYATISPGRTYFIGINIEFAK